MSSLIIAMALLAGDDASKTASKDATATVVTANRTAMHRPTIQGFVNARQVYAWSDGAIFAALTQPGMVTEIALQPGEALIAVAAGDTARWAIGDTVSGSGEARRTHILVKPYGPGLATNLVITTDRRVYHLQLASGLRGAMTALAWTYPQDELLALRRKAEAIESTNTVVAGSVVDLLSFDYRITGDNPPWRPVRVFDDGRQTYVEFPASVAVGQAPPLFLVGRKGKAELVNYRMQGRFYVVDRLFDMAELRLGTKHQKVVRISRTGPRKRA